MFGDSQRCPPRLHRRCIPVNLMISLYVHASSFFSTSCPIFSTGANSRFSGSAFPVKPISPFSRRNPDHSSHLKMSSKCLLTGVDTCSGAFMIYSFAF